MTYHVTPYSGDSNPNDNWQVLHEGSNRASSTHRKKRAAVRKAKSMARKHTGKKIVVHKSDGTTHYALTNTGTSKSPRWSRS